jgi:hypothetical protein
MCISHWGPHGGATRSTCGVRASFCVDCILHMFCCVVVGGGSLVRAAGPQGPAAVVSEITALLYPSSALVLPGAS